MHLPPRNTATLLHWRGFLLQLPSHILSQADKASMGKRWPSICHRLLWAGRMCCTCILSSVSNNLTRINAIQTMTMLLYIMYMLCRFSSNLWHTLVTVSSAVAVDFLLVGFLICTVGWYANSALTCLHSCERSTLMHLAAQAAFGQSFNSRCKLK